MVSNNDNCFVCGKKGHIGCCDDFGHFAKDCPKKIAPSGTPHQHNRSCSHSHHDHSCRDRSHSFHHRHARGTALTYQDHTFDPRQTEALVTTGGTHPTPYPITTAILIIPLQTHTLEETPTEIPHTVMGATHPDTHHARATPNTTLLITASSSRYSLGTTHRLHTRKVLKPHYWSETPHRPQHYKKVSI